MTAAYDDDAISSRRQENVKNSDVPVEFASQKIAAINLDESPENKFNNEENGTTSENSENSGNARRDLSSLDHCVESKTVDSSNTGRCIDIETAIVNEDDGKCTSSDGGNSLKSCLMLGKHKRNVEEIIIDKKENLSCIDETRFDNSIVTKIETGNVLAQEGEKKIFPDNIVIDKKLCTADLITASTELQLSSTSENNIRTEKKDFNYNLTDENKSEELNKISQELLIENEILSVNFKTQQNGIVKNIPAMNERESLNAVNCSIIESTNHSINSKDHKTAQKVSVPDIFEGIKNANSEILPNEENFEDYDPECEMSFHEAIRAGDAKSVEMLIARGVVQNIDEPDWNVSGDPPLLVAATNHSLPVLRVLLSNGCDPGVRSPRGETALHRAIINGSPSSVYEIVEELLKYGCPSTVKEAGGGLTALHVLTRQLAHAQSSKSLHHNFHIALKTLELLAKVGPVDAKDHQGRSALHLLASSSTFGNSHKIEIEPMIRTLLDAGADPALKNDRGETPLHEALECGALNTAFLLIPYTPIGITSRYGETPLHIAARKNQAEVVDSLLKRGEDPGFQDAGGNTPLHLASARGFHHTVSLLVTSPLAQLEKVNDDGLTSLQVAAESGFVNAVKLLLKAGADPSQTAHYCVTTLHRHPDISVLINHELTRRRQLAA